MLKIRDSHSVENSISFVLTPFVCDLRQYTLICVWYSWRSIFAQNFMTWRHWNVICSKRFLPKVTKFLYKVSNLCPIRYWKFGGDILHICPVIENIREGAEYAPSGARVNPPPPGLFLYPLQPGGSDPPPPLLSRKRIDVERRTKRHSKDLDETLSNNVRKFKIEVTCQVKVRSKVKIGCFQVADRSDLKRSIFRPKLSICTPKDQAKVLTSEIASYLIQVKVKVRSKKITKPKIFKCVVWHMFYGPFWTKNSKVTVILQFDLFWTKKMRKSIQGQVKRVKKGQIFNFFFFFWKQRHVSEAKSPQQSNGTISFPVRGL